MDEKNIIKVPYELMDNLSANFYHISDKISPHLANNGITPNMITLFRALLGVMTMALLNKNKLLAAVLIVIFYFLDCLDGHHARKNKMITKFGDYFDHIVDILFGISLVLYIYPKIDLRKKIMGSIIFVIMVIYVGCEQKYIKFSQSKINNDESLNISTYMCPGDSLYSVDKVLRITKYFSIGSFIIFLATAAYNSCTSKGFFSSCST